MSYPYFPFKLQDEDGGRHTVLSPYTNGGFSVNASAADLLRLCDGRRPVDELSEVIGEYYGVPSQQAASVAGEFLSRLEEKGLVWSRAEAMRWYNPPPPQTVFWEITAQCNLKCLHCVVSADRRLDGELSTAQAIDLITQWARLGVRSLTFSGGEPLMRPDFFQLADAARQMGLTANLATNGTTITEASARRIAALGMDTQISLDGSNEEIYGDFRGKKEMFAKAMEGARLLVKHAVAVSIATVATRKNISDIPMTLKLTEELRAQSFRLIPFVPYGRGAGSKELELSPDQMRALTEYLRGMRHRVPFSILPMEFEHTFDPPAGGAADRSAPSRCGGAVDYCTVTPLGEVLPCHYFEGVQADNVKESSFEHIWRKSRFLNYFRSIQVKDISGACQRCPWLAQCQGGCKAANFSHGAMMRSNVHCWAATAGDQTPPSQV